MSDPAPQAPVILYVDDEATSLKYFQRALGPLATVITAESVEQGKRLLDAHADTLAVLVSDQRMPGAYGNELLFYAWDRYPHIVRILTTAYSELEYTVDAVNQGQIHRYIQKPWDIAALRMELKQSLELARLRKEHALLLREKLLVRQKQAVANRIALLYTLCASVGAGAPGAPLEAYLSGALSAGMTPPEPDWLLMDHSELVSAEAFRGAAFGVQVRTELARIEQRCPGQEAEQALLLLAERLGGDFQAGAADGGVFRNPRQLTEFLETATGLPVSDEHAFLVACLLWLGRRGRSLQMSAGEGGVHCKLVAGDSVFIPAQLAAWIEQF